MAFFEHRTLAPGERLLRGFDDIFYAPHSRHTEIRRADIEKVSEIQLLAESDEAGVYLVGSRDGRHIFVTGHSEYDPLTLKSEYDRDVNKGLPHPRSQSTTILMTTPRLRPGCAGAVMRTCSFQTG